MKIRPVEARDVDGVVRLVREVLSEFGLEFGVGAKTDDDLLHLPASYASGAFWVAEKDGTLIGTCGVFPVSEKTYELRKMYVSSSARGLGLGQQLLDEAVDWCKNAGAKRIVLDTTHQMTRAIALYEKNGFTRDDREIRGARCSRGYARDL